MTRAVWLGLILVLTGITAPAWGQTAQPSDPATVVLLVRHAEKAAQPADDPPLTPDGRRRAEALAGVIKDAHPTAILTTQLRRTVETAQPSAAAVGVTPEVVPVSAANTQQNAVDVAAAVRKHAGATVLVVGHDNTVPTDHCRISADQSCLTSASRCTTSYSCWCSVEKPAWSSRDTERRDRRPPRIAINQPRQ